MASFGDMIQRISDELARSDINTNISQAIQTAIRKYERKRFYFNEYLATLTASIGQIWYTSADLAGLDKIAAFDTIKIAVSGTTYLLTPRNYAYIDYMDANLTQGDPTDYVYYRRQLRLYPTPTATRILTISGVEKAATLSGNADENYWTNDAEAMIRLEAKRIINRDIIRNRTEANNLIIDIKEEYDSLTKEYDDKVIEGGIQPNPF